VASKKHDVFLSSAWFGLDDVLVCMEQRSRRTDDGIDILPATELAKRLWAGKLISPHA
jgi:hypothetical protein